MLAPLTHDPSLSADNDGSCVADLNYLLIYTQSDLSDSHYFIIII